MAISEMCPITIQIHVLIGSQQQSLRIGHPHVTTIIQTPKMQYLLYDTLGIAGTLLVPSLIP